ncbi:FAD-binding domain-containing protein [Xylariaceae sp. AK1471]|nr:FAD-binding domain-containing protein [Xylariaceae sp. AK1471]
MASLHTSLQAYLDKQKSTTKLLHREHPDFESVRACFVKRLGVQPALIARPQNAEDVQTLVRYCVQNNVEFVVRTGGHDCAGRTQVHDILWIDMRDIDYVNIMEDKTTANIGGGILFRGLTKALGEEGLITPIGTIASVGYVGWATLGGYGPFSALYGLGADQIVGANVVNARGELVEANDELLKGIRGGGGIFGVIVGLTIKVYPLKEIISSTLVYDSSDMNAAWANFTGAYQKLADEKAIPEALSLQPFGIELPGVGKVLLVAATWVGQDQEEGNQWMEKLASLGHCVMKLSKPTTLLSYCEENEKLVAWGSYGRVHTISFKRYTSTTAAILARHTSLLPGGGAGISNHMLRSPKPNEQSVFGNRTSHHMIELCSTTVDPALEKKSDDWACAAQKDLLKKDPDNVVESRYIALVDKDDCDLKTVYGSHYDTLVALKKKYDPDNVFKYAIPRLFK